MKNNKTKKLVLFILLVSIILSFCFVIKNINHKCDHEEECPICELINNLKLEHGGLNHEIVELVIRILFSKEILLIPIIILIKKERTLIGLKVELNN